MRLSLKHIIIIFASFILLYSCSSSTRYSRSNDYSNTKNSRGAASLETEKGIASFYANAFNGRTTANGETYNMNDLTAAHPSYPFNTIVRVINLQNRKSVEVRINDRMPQFKGRIIDLSLAAAKKIDMIDAGIQEVKIEVLKWGGN